jgi:plasmid stabilization system protein ParE
MGEKEKRNFRLIVSENAISELEEIIDYINYINFQPINAAKIGEDFFNFIEKIASNPSVYKSNSYGDNHSESNRYANFYKWLIFFKVEDLTVEILGIMHGARKPINFKKY